MNYRIKTIPHNEQKYETAGDYYSSAEDSSDAVTAPVVTRNIFVSEMGNPDYEFLVAIHEFVESYLVAKKGLSDEEITKFDEEFEKDRKPGNLDEPGDSLSAPYRKEHRIATTIEKTAAHLLGVDWNDYERAVNSLYQHEQNTGAK